MRGWAAWPTVQPWRCSLPPDPASLIARGITFVAETGSTNADLVNEIRSGRSPEEGKWLVADRQTAGRGRRGRPWIDAPGNFMGSTLVCLRHDDPLAPTLSLVAALAVYDAIAVHLAPTSKLICKWPNDVLLDGAKFCGILLEREGDNVVIGIGVNWATQLRGGMPSPVTLQPAWRASWSRGVRGAWCYCFRAGSNALILLAPRY